MSAETPVLVDLKPSGNYYMEDFHRAGGVPAVLRELGSLINRDVLTVTGRTLGEEIDDAGPGFPQDIIRPLSDPIYPQGSLAVLRGNLAPGGAIIKQAAVSPALLEHSGPAVVFENAADLAARIDDPSLDVTADSVLVLKNIGPVGNPGMPEAGYLPIPKKLAAQGVKDMVRISDGRMSGTAAGAVVLHVTPESAVGGPLRLVRTGDTITLSVSRRLVQLEVLEEELAQREAELGPASPTVPDRGYRRLYVQEVTQADEGCDFRLLMGHAETP
jgi:dihydroxy-acid dehydratase